MNEIYNGKIAFWYRASWYHRRKILKEDGKVLYTKLGGFSTPEEAEESYYKCLKEFEDSLNKYETNKQENEVLLSDYIKNWFEKDYKSRISNSTAMITSFAIYNLIIPNISENIKLRYVTTEYLDEILQVISSISKSSGNKARQILSTAFKDAFNNKLIYVNPVIDTKKYKRNKFKIRLLKKEELKKLLIIIKRDYNWYLETLLGLFCGLRKGEIFGLKFSDFNLKDKTVSIKRQIGNKYELSEYEFNVKKIGITEKGPKTENSFRTIPVPQVILDELEKRKTLVNYYKVSNPDFEDNDYISCQPNGKPHSLSSLNGYLNKACLKAAVSRITVHTLRHMYATILLEQGVSLEKISALMGHESIHTTFDYYCDVMDENEKMLAYVNNEFVYKGGK